jgi:integrase
MQTQIPETKIVWYRGAWAAYWREDGQPQRRSLRTSDKSEAEQRLTDMRARWRAALCDGTVAGIYALYTADKIEVHKQVPQTVKYAWRVLEPFFAHMRPDQIDRATCREYVRARRAAGKKDGTIRRELIQLKAALRWHDPRTPAVFELPRDSEPREFHLTKDQYKALRDAADAGGEPHVRLYVELSRITAARMGAILDLRWSQVDLDRQIIKLRRPEVSEESILGPKRKPRATVPIPDKDAELLRAYKAAALSDYVVEYNGKPIKSIKRGFKRSVERAQLPKETTPHVIRHSCAVWMAEADTPMSVIQQYLGHQSIEITIKHYAQYSPSYLRKAMAAIDF